MEMDSICATVDGVQRAHPNGIKVVIIGAGVGGLTAALECWRKGCEVVVLERANDLSQSGTYLHHGLMGQVLMNGEATFSRSLPQL